MSKDNSFLSKDTLSEDEVRLLLRRLNSGKIKVGWLPNIREDKGYKLTNSQIEKGKRWLTNLWKTPTGKERLNNPFGGREEYVLENFKTIKLVDFYSERGNYYVPVYKVYSTDGRTFEYMGAGKNIKIIG